MLTHYLFIDKRAIEFVGHIGIKKLILLHEEKKKL